MQTSTDLARSTIGVVLAGGNGTRLGKLTRQQCKPAIPFAGQFRNIDFTLSNCVNSEILRIGVLTQYKAQTLIEHITDNWNFLPRQSGQFVDVWPSQHRVHSKGYVGTADAVYQNLDHILAERTKYTLVLAGDHIYKMDYRKLLEHHVSTGAEVTVGTIPVPVEQASAFGIIRVDDQDRVRTFMEKPAPTALGITHGTVLASMGIYVFDTDYLVDRLTRDARNTVSVHDFGKDILPCAVRDDHVAAYSFTDELGQPAYWRDVGTLEAYWQAHMELVAPQPALDLYDAAWPVIMSSTPTLPAGTIARSATIKSSVLAPDVHVDENSEIDEAVVLPGARIGANCTLRRVIVDAGTVVPDGTVLSDSSVTLVTSDSFAEVQRRCPPSVAGQAPGLYGAVQAA